MTPGFWRGRRVLVTGTTGFKGAWLAELLLGRGAIVCGAGLTPDTDPSLFDLLALGLRTDHRTVDLSDPAAADALLQATKPELVLHLSAQALVRRGYEEPAITYTSNTLGAVNLLEAVRLQPSVQGVVHVTTDKVYAGDGDAPHRETDPLGGRGPYSTSKVCAELVTREADRRWASDRGMGLATARAGNTLGGGDQAPDRLVCDCIRAVMRDHPVTLRNPDSVRPWMHVLDTLDGYLRLAEQLHAAPRQWSGAWNFGPEGDEPSVGDVARRVLAALGEADRLVVAADPEGPPERAVLRLDSTRARCELGWRPRLSGRDAVDWTAAWYAQWLAGRDAAVLCREQIAAWDGLG